MCFIFDTSCVKALGWLKKERKKEEEEDEQFWILVVSRLATLEKSLASVSVTIVWGRLDKQLQCFQSLAFISRRRYRRVYANTSIGAAILFFGHPYIWAHYREPIIIDLCM